MIKFVPMPFSPAMARANVELRKRQTRRLLKLPSHPAVAEWILDSEFGVIARPHSEEMKQQYITTYPFGRVRPNAVPGDVIYQRERIELDDENGWVFAAGGELLKIDRDEAIDWENTRPAMKSVYPPIHMPAWACRCWGVVKSVRVERVQDITEEDAIAEGFSPAVCKDVFAAMAKGVKEGDRHYIEDADGNDAQCEWCFACAQKHVEQHGGTVWRDTGESDGPAWCETCGVVLTGTTLTDYGIARELFLETNSRDDVPYFAAHGSDAVIARDFARNVPDEHLGRLAQIGFATCIDLLNGKGTWAKNPWVTVYEYEPTLDAPEGWPDYLARLEAARVKKGRVGA